MSDQSINSPAADRDDAYDSAALGQRPMSDFEWYAVDRRGQLAFLTSAGFGAVPMLVFRNKRVYSEAAEFFRKLPLRCGHVRFAGDCGDMTSWINASRQGLFGYDWNAEAASYVPNTPYRKLTAPESSLILHELPIGLREWISPIRFELDFAEASELFPELQFDEVND